MKTGINKKLNLNKRLEKLEMKLPLEKFIPAAFLIFLLSVFILSLITYQNIDRYKNDIDWLLHSNDVLKKIGDLKIDVIEIPNKRMGYLITGDLKLRSEYDSLVEEIKSRIDELKILVSDNPQQFEYIENLSVLISENTELMDSSFRSSPSGELISAPFSDRQRTITENVNKNINRLNSLTNELFINEMVLLNNRSERAERSNSRIQSFIIITGLFSFIVTGLALYISEKLLKNKQVAESLLMKSYEELEERVEERTEELKESNDKLSDEIAIRIKTEETLRESESRFRMMADSAPVLIWVSGKDKLFTYFNNEWLDFTGRKPEQELGNGWTEGVHKEDLQRCLEIYSSSFDKRIPFEMEYRLKDRNNEFKWLLQKGSPRFEGKEFAGYIGSCIEIDERIRNERFLKIQYDISRTLSESDTIAEASKKLLKNICSGIRWNFGILWMSDDKSEYINADYIWADSEEDENIYLNTFKEKRKFAKGSDFPGIIFKEGISKWTYDLSSEKNEDYKSNQEIIKFGWNSRLGIPVSIGKETIAIIECFNKYGTEKDDEIIEVLESAGRQIGSFIQRKKAEQELIKSNIELEEKVKQRTNDLANALSKLIKESEEKDIIQNRIKIFAHAIKSIKDNIFIADLNNKIIFINEAFENTYGYDKSWIEGKDIPVFKNITGFLKNDIISKTLKNGWRGELKTNRSDGTEFHTYLSTSSIKDENGNAEAWVGICQDITQLKEKEEVILKKNNLLMVLNEVIRYTNSAFDPESAIQYSIDKISSYTNWEIGHCFLRKQDDFVSSEIWNSNLSVKYLPFKKISDNLILKNGDGFPIDRILMRKPSWISLKNIKKEEAFKRENISVELGLKTGIWVPVMNSRSVVGVLEFFKIEEQETDREILDCIMNIGVELGSLFEKIDSLNNIKKNEKDLKAAQSIAKLGSWEWDIINNIITWSDEMYSIYGIDKNNYKPSFEEFTKRLHPDDREYVKNIIQNSLENKTPFSFYHKIITPDGIEKILKAQGEVYLDEKGNVIRMFGTGHDVTELTSKEEELKMTNLKLVETQKELIYNEKLAALGRFSSGIAHEIRNPLANISSLAQLISKSGFDEKNTRRLNYIITNVELANKIIKNLLSFASPEELDLSEVRISEVLKLLIETVEARCKNSNIEIISDIEPDLPSTRLDKLKLENAFMNFISNSIESMEDGGTLSVKAFMDKINNEINIEFSDTGIGIPSENMDKILEPFFTTKDTGVGLGMGLAFQTIRLHNGIFKINSEEDSGTQIRIKLPIYKNSN
ncbi:MAG TPA: PAS domain S-box protein [Ignavibacteria bacterium]|nr:PAS domain S-box protein [Ignavibacteria bacterium]